VKEIALPAPVSNVGPETGQNPEQTQNPAPVTAPAAPPVVPPAALPVAPPLAPPVAPPATNPISNVKPEVGYNSGAHTAKPVQRTAPQTVVRLLPRTGEQGNDNLWLAFAGALTLSVLGLTIRRQAFQRR